MEVTTVEKGMKFILNDGTEVECLGDGVFGDINTGRKYLEDNLPSPIKYGYASNSELANNSMEVSNPTKGFLNDEQPLDLPDFNFEGQGTVAEPDGDHSPEPLVMPSMF